MTALEARLALIAQKNYDYVIIDTPPRSRP
jgi:cellulose biosynthesis protein BcsQ